MEDIQQHVLKVKTKYSSLDFSVIVKSTKFKELVQWIRTDFTTAYNTKGYAKYEDFQIKLFSGLSAYLYTPGIKKDAVSTLFQSDGLDIGSITNIFPAVYQSICNVLHHEVIKYLAKGQVSSNQNDLDLELDEQLYRMHGWVLYELKKKTVYKELLEDFTMCTDDKKSLPPYLHFLDVGTNTGLTFPKPIFLSFMKASDSFIREQFTDEKFDTYGSNIIKVTKTVTENNVELHKMFEDASLICSKADKKTIQAIYNCWVEKYLNMKMKGRFDDAMERMATSKTKRITTKTQNLRDTLLSNHVK